MFIIQTSFPNGSLWANGAINFALPYFVLSVSMSVTATGLMVWRMLSVLPKINFALGKSEYTLLLSVCGWYCLNIRKASNHSIHPCVSDPRGVVCFICYIFSYLHCPVRHKPSDSICFLVGLGKCTGKHQCAKCFIVVDSIYFRKIIAPLLIVFRVSKGKAWNRTTTESISRGPELAKRVTRDEESTLKMKTLNIGHSTTLLAHESL